MCLEGTCRWSDRGLSSELTSKHYRLHHFHRLRAKPGLTRDCGRLAGRSSILDFEEVVEIDSRYVREWSLLLDVQILLQTPWAVLRGRGAM